MAPPRRAVAWANRHQVPLFLAAIAVGALIGVCAPVAAPALSTTITPVLGLLLFATFLGVPLAQLGHGFRDIRFLGTLLAVNFVIAPLVAFALSRFVVDDRGLLLGVLLVLLTPCVDYVIVFTGLAGGDRARLLAATPLLMLLQIVLLPVYLLLFAGSGTVTLIEFAPFAAAFVLLVAVPLAAALAVQFAARRLAPARAVMAVFEGAMVPLMMLTLAVVVASQIAAVGAQALTVLRVVPLFAAFLAVMVLVGLTTGRIARIDVPGLRAVMFSGSTRNSLVVLPLALALPAELGLAPLAVVTQTLVEVLGMVAFVRLVPWLTRGRAQGGPGGQAQDGQAQNGQAQNGQAQDGQA